MKKIRGILIVLLALTHDPVVHSQERTPPSPLRLIVLDKILAPIRKQRDVPALAAAIVSGNGVESEGVVGVRKRGTDVLATVNDHWHLGSDTKAMTAWLTARLAEDGKLRWGATLPDSLPDLTSKMQPEFKTVTLEELLSHQAGFAEQFNLHQLDDGAKILTLPDVRQQRREAARQLLLRPIDHPPRSRFAYTNVGYILAGSILENATDESWEDLMRKRVFAPLGMRKAGFGGTGTAGEMDQPWPHKADGQAVANGPKTDNPPVLGPAGTVHASFADWGRFIADELRGFRGAKAELTAASYNRLKSRPFGGHYAVGGWGCGDWRGKPTFQHDGSNTFNYCTAFLVPDLDIAVLVCTNQGGEAAKNACHDARKEILDKALALEK